MKIRIPLSASPSVEPELLVRFVMRKCQDIEPSEIEPSPIVAALALAAISQELDFYNRLRDVISSSDAAEEILGMSRHLFMPALGRLQDDEVKDSFPVEHNCRRVLHYAFHEGKRMISEQCYEYVKVFQFLTRTGLRCYSFRLYEFEAACELLQNDSENLIRRGLEIIESATAEGVFAE